MTHAFKPGIPHWQGFPDETRKTLYWYEPLEGTLGSGFFAQQYCHVGQWGTHVELKEMILPLNDYSLETYILSQNHYQIELLTNLDQVPEYGALAVVTFPKPKEGSGFTARVFAILP